MQDPGRTMRIPQAEAPQAFFIADVAGITNLGGMVGGGGGACLRLLGF